MIAYVHLRVTANLHGQLRSKRWWALVLWPTWQDQPSRYLYMSSRQANLQLPQSLRRSFFDGDRRQISYGTRSCDRRRCVNPPPVPVKPIPNRVGHIVDRNPSTNEIIGRVKVTTKEEVKLPQLLTPLTSHHRSTQWWPQPNRLR